mgnify:CR=1 FL=1
MVSEGVLEEWMVNFIVPEGAVRGTKAGLARAFESKYGDLAREEYVKLELWLASAKVKFRPRMLAKVLAERSPPIVVRVSVLKGWLEVVSPPKIKNYQGVVKGIEEWKEKIKQVESIEEEKVPMGVKSAVLIGMVPNELQDFCFQLDSTSIKSRKEQFDFIQGRVVNLATQRIQMHIPTPMDVGSAEEEACGMCLGDNPESAEEFQDCLGSVQKGQCARCHGWGHYAKDCPTPKGGGKGNKGESKGGAKGGGPGRGGG